MDRNPLLGRNSPSSTSFISSNNEETTKGHEESGKIEKDLEKGHGRNQLAVDPAGGGETLPGTVVAFEVQASIPARAAPSVPGQGIGGSAAQPADHPTILGGPVGEDGREKLFKRIAKGSPAVALLFIATAVALHVNVKVGSPHQIAILHSTLLAMIYSEGAILMMWSIITEAGACNATTEVGLMVIGFATILVDAIVSKLLGKP